MKTPEVSIVIPVYNCAKYIRRCIDSVLNQTFQDFELIVIDDGSTDNTLEIIKKYKDKRIRVYHQKNQGPANTRNRGIKLAKGRYLMFIDGDDYIDQNYIQVYYNAISAGKYDLIIGGYQHVKNGKADFTRQLKPGPFAKYIVVGPVCKMYDIGFLKKHRVHFLDTTASEDAIFRYSSTRKAPPLK